MQNAKPTLGVIVGNRNFFADSLVADGRKKILDKLAEFGVDVVIVDEQTTKLGAVETWADAQKCADLFKRNRDRIDGILVTLPNFGDEKGIADAIHLSGLNAPVLVHAFPDTTSELTVAGRRDAFCGKFSVTNNLYQYGIKFSLTQNHTVDPDKEEFKQEIDRFVRLCRTVRGMRSARLGAVGARPNAFQTVRFSEKLFQAYGINVSTMDLSEAIGKAQKLENSHPRVRSKVDEIKSYAVNRGAPEEKLALMAKLAIVLDDWMDANSIDATAIQCWDSIQQNYGVNVCTVMSMMSERLMPSACEVDIAGTASMYALTLAAGMPAALVDWNNNYNDEPNKCLYFHCGNWAKSLVSEIELISAEVLGATLGPENTWGAIQGRTPPGPLTFARIDTDDRRGVIHTYVGEGRFTDDPISTISGSHAVVEVPDLQRLLRTICRHGFAHHAAMTRSHVADVLAEAFETYLGWEVYHHQ
ncbi:L-fucose/L-arabinose isomerase family protein [Caldilinea sp.]|uniref:L-fucose/L-arabinose isomerase family protein n=1 Tax=Caldilinea sp. TaxID=2293560 RepID=UPI0021DBF78A|nr:L-fucose/L-arabinose isomerase family protein [Caldilinea sp.]GIV70992.1 MAG: fucose isomerase [Caldilinea sp.]